MAPISTFELGVKLGQEVQGPSVEVRNVVRYRIGGDIGSKGHKATRGGLCVCANEAPAKAVPFGDPKFGLVHRLDGLNGSFDRRKCAEPKTILDSDPA